MLILDRAKAAVTIPPVFWIAGLFLPLFVIGLDAFHIALASD